MLQERYGAEKKVCHNLWHNVDGFCGLCTIFLHMYRRFEAEAVTESLPYTTGKFEVLHNTGTQISMGSRTEYSSICTSLFVFVVLTSSVRKNASAIGRI